MRHRIEDLLDSRPADFWIGPLRLAHRLWRIHWREAGWPEGFQISIRRTNCALSGDC